VGELALDAVPGSGGRSAAAGGVTLSIVSHRQAALVQDLLRDLQRVDSPLVERVVLTLNLDEPPPAAAASFGERLVLVRNATPLGFGANHNRAFRHCASEWFAVLNPDLRLDADPFAPLLEAARPEDALLSPAILERDGSAADAARRVLTPWQLARRALGNRAPAGADYDWLAGMFLLVRSAAFRASGGFDERYFMYSEDAELCLRLQLAGKRVRQVPSARVVHAAQRASRRSWQHFRWHVTSLLRYWTSSTYWRYLARRRAIHAARGA
jgi:N-acetylglucosaminyl-diphospho-decaprenol L-rhamnosyltransferase